MNIAYSLVAVFFLIVAVIAAYRNIVNRSLIFLKFLGKYYSRKSNIVTGSVVRYEWGTGGGYWMICRIDEDNTGEIKLPCDSRPKQTAGEPINESIPLIAVDGGQCTVYMRQKRNAPTTFQKCQTMSEEEVQKINKNATAVLVFAVVLWGVGFACIQSFPVISTALFMASTILFSITSTVRSWKNNTECCTIYKKESCKAKSVEERTKNPFPPGYDYWSQRRKELFEISVRMDSEREEEQENAALDEKDVPMEGWTNIDSPEMDMPTPDEDAFLYTGLVPRPCKNCGCIIDVDASFCPNCGAAQKEQKSKEMPKHIFPTSAEEQNTLVSPPDFEAIFDTPPQETLGDKLSTNQALKDDVVSETSDSLSESPCQQDTSDISGDFQNGVDTEGNEKNVPPQEAGLEPKGPRKPRSKNRRHRPAPKKTASDVDKMLQSLENPAN